ncbi:hypothetical protein GGTG_02742 [Gaeumannomyces tritici R3-111a-1]|uniref:Uncharacterized protein n=1 Tax=Gaeumannomyces tritici (strain R3-111a-1) TaxID=644352 RepID=J3NN84_GAET3|nr:hypothetical protein GGTG_02742 [Gaeumannomyces tritici R3-111a-1]EJT77636.1 hypothetical protein GGTG_02742 [Gaeumannomyces tritici R3-111a-1]
MPCKGSQVNGCSRDKGRLRSSSGSGSRSDARFGVSHNTKPAHQEGSGSGAKARLQDAGRKNSSKRPERRWAKERQGQICRGNKQ